MNRRDLMILSAASSVTPVLAGGGAEPRSGTLSQQVIGKATGKNGYEELVLAAELFQGSRAAETLSKARFTLTERRRLLADPTVRKVFLLIRKGLSKPVFSPRTELDFSTLLPEVSQFRQLGRLIVAEQYVLLADGRVPDAIQSARLLLRFAQVIQTDTLISGLVGIAIAAMGYSTLASRLDQFCARDCELLHGACLEWLQQPSPLVRMAETEAQAIRKMIGQLAQGFREKGVAGLQAELNMFGSDAAGPMAEEFLRRARTEPGFLDGMVREVNTRVDRYFQQVRTELRKPVWEQKLAAPEPDGSLAGQFLSMFAPSFTRVAQTYARDNASIRLLACHTAIRRYRWEQTELPPTLEPLRLGELAVDPFNGLPLQYEVRQNRYRLTSIGAPTGEDDPLAVSGRRPVTLGLEL